MSKLTDKLVGSGVKPELSPNPAFSGFTKQIVYEVGSLPKTLTELATYIDGVDTTYYDLRIENWLHIEPHMLFVFVAPNGEEVYWTVNDPRPDGYATPAENICRVYPNLTAQGGVLEKGEHGTPVKEVTAPKVRPHVFNEPVAFNEGVFVKGKKLEDYIDSEGGVTEEEMENFVENVLEDDKDIISQVTSTFNETTNVQTITFPLGVLPLSMYEDEVFGDTVYFDYQIRKIRSDEYDTSIESRTSLSISNGHIVLTISSQSYNQEPAITTLMYFHLQGNAQPRFNSHKLLRPQDYSSGTKLYRHLIDFNGNEIYITSAISEECTTIASIVNVYRSLFIGFFSSASYGTGTICNLDDDSVNVYVKYYDASEDSIRAETLSGSFTDTVTAL